jgi:glycosyltransferase involved in cell wall biosynthesis
VRFSLIIVTKDRPESLRDALQSAVAVLPVDAEVIVVDGDPGRSARGVIEGIRIAHPNMSVRYLESDPGMTLQRNVGIDAAKGEVVVFTDDDCRLDRGLFEALAVAYEDPTVVGVTGQVIQPPLPRLGSDPHSRLRWLVLGGGRQGKMTSFGFRRPIVDLEQSRDVEFMPGPLMSARRALAAEVRFDERLEGYGLGEDDDFSYRVSRRGRVRYEPTAMVHHHELGWRRMDRRERDHRQVVNRTYLFRKNFPGTPRARAGFALLMAMLLVHRVLNREWEGVRGLLEGIRDTRLSPPSLLR